VSESALVTDTHALLYYAGGDRRLSRKAKAHFAACERREALTYVPAAVLWETSALVHAGRINLNPSFRGFVENLFSNPAYQLVDLTTDQIFLAHELRPNSDPFDSLICAVARQLELPLLTRDAEITRSGIVRTVW